MSPKQCKRYLLILTPVARGTVSARLTTDTPATCDAECREVNKLIFPPFFPARPRQRWAP